MPEPDVLRLTEGAVKEEWVDEFGHIVAWEKDSHSTSRAASPHQGVESREAGA